MSEFEYQLPRALHLLGREEDSRDGRLGAQDQEPWSAPTYPRPDDEEDFTSSKRIEERRWTYSVDDPDTSPARLRTKKRDASFLSVNPGPWQTTIKKTED